jgi:hypothetical protein
VTFQIIATALACIAAGIAVWGAVDGRRTVLRLRAERRTFAIPGGGEVTVTAPMSEAEYEALKPSWLKAHGRAGAVCSGYQPPATSEDSGLCARCGMFDYKHEGVPGA